MCLREKQGPATRPESASAKWQTTTPRQQLSPVEVTATLGSTEGEVNCASDTSLPKCGEAMTRYPTTTHCRRGILNEYHVQSPSHTWVFSIDHQHISISRYVNYPRRDDMRMARRADTRALFFVHNRIVRCIERYEQ